MDRQKRRKIVIYVLAGVITFLAIVVSVARCSMLILEDYTFQLKQNLYDVSMQSAETLETQINARYDMLKSLNMRFEKDGEHRREALNDLSSVVDAYHLKRLGFVEKDGIAYSTDGSGTNISYRAFFKHSINGEVYISDILSDALEEKHEGVIVMSMPMRNANGDVEAVTCITYEAESLGSELSHKSFEGYGDNFVLNQNGVIVSSSNTKLFPVAERFIDSDFTGIDDNVNIKSELARNIINKSALAGSLKFNNEDYFFQIVPVEIMEGKITWFVMSMVPYDYLNARFSGIKNSLFKMILIVFAIVLVAVITIRQFFTNQRKMTYSLAYISTLTGGYNLAHFFETMKSEKNRDGYIVYMNLEDFTHTSVATGIEASNGLIRKIWGIICENINYGEHACHDKADSFVLFLRENTDTRLKDRLEELKKIIHEEGHGMNIPWVFAKFGVFKISDEDEVKAAYSKAEYTVFDTWGKKECVSFYSDEDHEKQALNKQIEENFDEALAEKRFEVWYQPKYSAVDGKNTGAEALVRWRKKDGSLLPPGVFIPLLEENGEISKLDEYVFEHVCEKIREWRDKGIKIMPVSINLSRATLYRDKIVETYMEIMKKNNVAPFDIQLEVTESIVGGSENIQELLTNFRNKGIKILMDDFGTGYSSLSTLNMKCFDTLKIDKSLVDEIEDDYGRIIIYQTIEMGNALGLYVTVEGVEDKKQLELLQKTKCNDIQGYFFSRPLPEREFEENILM